MKILHLEDNFADAELVRDLLTDEWKDCEITLVSGRKDYATQLAAGGYDVILSDFSLIQFNGVEALEMAREQVPEIPFIFLSGNIGEDRAIAAVRAGAQDYVLKDRVKRLTTAIRRALRESEERKRLRATEADRERLTAIVENTPDFVGLIAPDGRLLYLNQAARHMVGPESGSLPEDFGISSIYPAEVVRHLLNEHFPAAVRDGTWSGESVLRIRDGITIPVSQILIAHRDESGAVDYFSTVIRDLTPREKSEALVNGQNQVLEMIAGGEPLNETLDTLLRFIERQSSDMICSILTLDDDERHLRHCAAPSLPDAYTAAVDGLAVGPAAGSCGTAAYRRAPVIVSDIETDQLWQSYRDLALPHGLRSCWSVPIFDLRHRLLGTFAVYQKRPGEPTERHRQLIDIATHIAAICLSRYETERQLRNQADILSKASDAIMVTDLNHRVVFWNDSAGRKFGWTAAEALGREDRDLFGSAAAAEIETMRKLVDQIGEWRGEMRLQSRSGQQLIVESSITVIRDQAGRPSGRLSISTDVTAKKKIEEQFFRAQRLESLGMLAAGIAHDLNNVLAPMLLAAPLLRDHTTDPSDLRLLGTLEKSAERGAALVRQILGFAHGADSEHHLIQAKHVLRDVANFVEETFPKSILCQSYIPSDLLPVRANPTQVHQVLLNLCVNARDAMPDGGTLTLRGENISLDEIAATELEGARPGSFLVLHVQDTGTGIPPEVLAHIWEPFFTTKESGKGTGLGLSTVRGIVENHSGFVTVATTPGKGTVFRIYLPATVSTVRQSAGGAKPAPTPDGTGELILVVDDEPSIRNMAAAIFTRHGYRVLTASDGAQAIALFAPRSKEIRAVVTDLSMPNLDGATLAGVIHRLNSAVKIIAMSGLGADADGAKPNIPFSDAFIAKPFRAEELIAAVHELLKESPRSVR